MKAFLKELVSKNISFVPLSVMGVAVKWRIRRIPKNLAPLVSYLSPWDFYIFQQAQITMNTLMGVPVTSTDEKISTNRPVIFAIIGLPQHGKTVVAQAFREATGAVTFENNALRVYLDKHKAGVVPFINEVAFTVAQKTIARGFNPFLDSDFANPVKRRMLEAFAAGLGADVQYIRVTCDKEVFESRIASTTHVFGKLYHNAVRDMMRKKYLNAVIPDTFRASPEELASCVRGECARQEPDNLLPSPSGTIEISSNATKAVMEQAVRIQAYKFMAQNAGTEMHRQWFQRLYDQAIPKF